MQKTSAVVSPPGSGSEVILEAMCGPKRDKRQHCTTRMAGNMAFALRVLSQHDATSTHPSNTAVAGLELHRANKNDAEHPGWGIVPPNFMDGSWDSDKLHPGRRVSL